jgi:hypothetical protein
MNKDFVEYEEALELKGLGFDEPCFGVYATKDGYVRKSAYDENGDAPTYSQAFRWFREKHKLNGETPYLPNVEKYGIVASDMTIKPKELLNNENFKRGVEVTNNFAKYDTHEEAELACLKKLIKIVK